MLSLRRCVHILFLISVAFQLMAQNKKKSATTDKKVVVKKPINFNTANLNTSVLKKNRILFIFDASYSMLNPWSSGQKMDVAKKLLGEFVDSLKTKSNLEIALRCYGHQFYIGNGKNCKDSRLEVPFGAPYANAEKIKSKLYGIIPTGTTPIAYSLEQCATDFTPCENCNNIVILITDGQEECSGDPCAVSLALQSKGVFLRPFIIGVGLNIDFADAFGCIGKFYDVSNENNFKQVLNYALTEATSQTTVQVNLNDISGTPTETDANMTFYDAALNEVKYQYMHTINHRGKPDTIILDPDKTYNIEVHTLPKQIKTGVQLQKGIHNVIDISAPQGYLNLKMKDGNTGKSVSCLIKKAGEDKTFHVQALENTSKYIVGKYDLEFLTLPRIKVNNIEIKQSSTNTIEIPHSGTFYLAKSVSGFGSIYVEADIRGGEQQWVCNLNDVLNNETYFLQPGNYKLVFRPKSVTESELTIVKKFTIESGKTIELKL
jgi:Ca-activated chloride channel homolog